MAKDRIPYGLIKATKTALDKKGQSYSTSAIRDVINGVYRNEDILSESLAQLQVLKMNKEVYHKKRTKIKTKKNI